jgi:hypothetical protein
MFTFDVSYRLSGKMIEFINNHITKTDEIKIKKFNNDG